MYVVACKDSNELFIDVALQEGRLLYLNINLFIDKKKRKKEKNKNHIKKFNYIVVI